jgi:hypothetical protein
MAVQNFMKSRRETPFSSQMVCSFSTPSALPSGFSPFVLSMQKNLLD